ncbi:Dopey, N-terminal-domain-containing protein [Syncephalastrum racemosum]|uniref:Dopey, N-terminal-domain-containing protein n=1 Tax=Syncephalastrum racemosum TaxID=13706 RepID=A0A1X2H3B1_SYNRA|nr:Dopey, N-terminal-domain-containing protein [Syncephalastrum racemosum]
MEGRNNHHHPNESSAKNLSPHSPLSISQKLFRKISIRSLSEPSDNETDNSLPGSPGSPRSESVHSSPKQTSRPLSSSATTATSPLAKLEQNTAKEQAYTSDPRFRKYVQLIEKNLNSFDAVNEWADIISFLGRLLKSFQAYPQFPIIPRKHTVAKRLAQCLNPGFPAGVHQKTLDVYAYILETIGTDQLADDLALWSLGLFPFVQYAAMHVKPQLLSIFETYYFPLKQRLRPAMRGFIIALLPALDEEGSEFFDKVVVLMDHLANTVNLPFFYSCLWLVLISNPNLRPPALNYLLRRLPKIVDQEETALVLGIENVGLMVRAFSATLTDSQLLVQRGMLELLVQNFQLKHRTIPNDDLVVLMRAALSIVLRKDMSLNRRLYAWLLGNENGSQLQMVYFDKFAKKAATQAVRGLFFATTDAGSNQFHDEEQFVTESQRPYKILISLLDKWEIGQPVVQDIFVDSLTSLQIHVRRGTHGAEILQTANMWMEMTEPYLIWMKLFEMADGSFPGKSPAVQGSKLSSSKSADLENLRLLEFALTSFKFTDEEIKHMHLPLFVGSLTQKLYDSIRHDSFIDVLPLIDQCLRLVHIILQAIPESFFWDRKGSKAVSNDPSSENSARREFQTGTSVLNYAREFYTMQTQQQRPSQNNNESAANGLASEHMPSADDEGDLSTTHNTSNANASAVAAIPTRPAYGPIRGSILVQELLNYLTQFLVELVNRYIVPPEDQDAGVDVGVDGKRLRSIDAQLEKILHSVCRALTFVVQRSDERFTWQDGHQEALTRTLLLCCQEGREFGVVDAGLSTLTQVAKRGHFVYGDMLKKRSALKKVLDRLWSFLSPRAPLLHMRTVQMMWRVTETSHARLVEGIVAEYLITSDDAERLENYEKFGIVWELSDDILETSTVFARPMFIILDLLREGASPMDRRVGETWIRRHLRSYIRLLEPFVLTLLDKGILRRAAELVVPCEHQTLKHGNDPVVVPYFLYMRPFDMETVDYMFKTLIALAQFGSLGFLKTCRNHRVGTSGSMSGLIETGVGISLHEGQHASLSFLELLVRIALQFLESEPCEKHQVVMLKPTRSIQLHATDLLYLMMSRLDFVDMKLTRMIQETVLRKLLYCVATENLELQQKLLHLLHATMAITSVTALGHHHAASASPKVDKHTRRKTSIDTASSDAMAQYASDAAPLATSGTAANASQIAEAIALARSTSGLFVKCVIDALTHSSNRPLLQHWMDFVLASLPHLRGGFRQIVVPILMCLCEQTALCQTAVMLLMHGEAISSWSSTYHRRQISEEVLMQRGNEKTDIRGPYVQDNNAVAGGPEQDVLVFLNGLEKVLMFCMTDRSLSDDWLPESLEDFFLPIPNITDQSMLSGLAQLVHADDSHRPGDHKPRDTILYHLPVVLHILLDVWRVFRRPEWDAAGDTMGFAKKEAVLQSFAYAADHVKARLENIFERLYKYCTVDFIEGFTEIFFIENPIALEYEASREQFDLIAIEVLSATPTSSPPHILSTLLDGIRQRTPGMTAHRRRHIMRVGNLTDTSLLRFTEIYCGNLIKADSLAHLWPLIQSFAKDYLSQASAYKTFFPGLLRFLTVALDGLTRASTNAEDRKMRRDAQDLYQRCADYCILIAGRSFDQSLWLRRSNLHNEEEESSSVAADSWSLSDTIVSESARNMSTSNVSELEKKASWKSREDVMITQVNAYLATAVIPHLRQLIGDQDRINSLLNNLVYYVIGPALRTRVVFNKISIILDQICEMSKMPFTYRTWRKEVWDVFLDNRFFYMGAATAKKWKTIIQTVLSLEKERFTEVVGRITTSPSTAFFTNKDQETVNRALNLRRLSYIIFCGAIDQYVPQLPVIQEKIVELLKLEHGEMVHVEIYLCLRIMLVRFSQKHLLNFWPVLITELMRLFNAFLYNNVHDRPEEAQIALAGCKFLDLLCALELDAFQIYEWIFIRDTVQELSHSEAKGQVGDEDGPMPIMDMLSEKLSTHAEPSNALDQFSVTDTVFDTTSSVPSAGQLKRPMLTMRSISSIRQLAFFIDHVNLYVYQSSYTLAQPDLPFIESLLQHDLMEGDIEAD